MTDELPLDTPPDDATLRAEIDAMPYAELVRKVRTAPLTDPMFRGDIGKHFHATLKKKRGELSPDARAAIHAKLT